MLDKPLAHALSFQEHVQNIVLPLPHFDDDLGHVADMMILDDIAMPPLFSPLFQWSPTPYSPRRYARRRALRH